MKTFMPFLNQFILTLFYSNFEFSITFSFIYSKFFIVYICVYICKLYTRMLTFGKCKFSVFAITCLRKVHDVTKLLCRFAKEQSPYRGSVHVVYACQLRAGGISRSRECAKMTSHHSFLHIMFE